MPALDVSDFISKPNQYGGLYAAANNLEQQNERKDRLQLRADAHRNSLMSSLLSMADPKDFFTGTPQDPIITQGINNILQKGAKLITDNPGLTADMLYTGIANDVNKISTASQNLKQVAAQKKMYNENLKAHKGIDMDKFNQQFNQQAFLNPDGSLKDLSNIDPQQDYGDYTLRNGEIYNNSGFDEFAKNAEKNTTVGRIKTTDPRGGMKLFKSELTSPNYLVSEKDKEGNHTGFVPKFEISTDNGIEQLHEFQNEDGTKTTAPVRVLSQDVFHDLPADAKAYLLQEARKHAKDSGLPINSTQVENFARAIGYDELNSASKKWGTVKTIEEQKAPQIKVYNNSGSSKGASEVTIREVYPEIIDKLKKVKGAYGISLTELSGTAQGILKKYANGENKDDFNPKDFFLKDDGKGGVQLREYPSENLITTINEPDVQIPAQVGVKEKRSVIQRAKDGINKVINKAKKTISW